MLLYFGDLGKKEAFKKMAEVFNAGKILISENVFKRDLTESQGKGYKRIEQVLKVKTIGMTYQTTRTDFAEDEGDQLDTRTLNFTPFEADNDRVLDMIFNTSCTITKESKAQKEANNKALEYHSYLKYIIGKDIEIINPFITVFKRLVGVIEQPRREFSKLLALFNGYCTVTYFNCDKRYSNYYVASTQQIKEFISLIHLDNTLAPHELNFTKMLMGIKQNTKKENNKTKNALTLINIETDENDESENLNPLNPYFNEVLGAMGYNLDSYTETIETLEHNQREKAVKILLQKFGLKSQSLEFKENVFFRITDIKRTHFNRKPYKNVDNPSSLLNKLYNKGYVDKLEFKDNTGQNIYYLTFKCKELTKEFKLEDNDITESFNWLQEQNIKPNNPK